MDHHSWIKDEIERLRQNNLWRSLRSVESLPHGRTKIDGREIILLGSNNYLGLSAHPQVIEAAKNALVGFGTGSSGSRLTTGNLNLYAELEEKIAKLKQTEAASYFTHHQWLPIPDRQFHHYPQTSRPHPPHYLQMNIA